MAQTQFEVDRENLEVRITRVFDVSPERLWQAHTEPEQIERWWDTTRVETMDVRVGGRWRFVSGEHGEHAFRGEFLEIDKPHKLVRTFEYEPMAGHILVETVLFEPLDGGKTRLKMTSKYSISEDLEGMVANGMEQGSTANLERLATLVERSA